MTDPVKPVSIVGRVLHTPEIRATRAGVYSATFRVNSLTLHRIRGGRTITRERSHIIVAYGDVAIDVRNVVRKGDHLQIDGHLQLKQWESRSAGTTKYLSQISADSCMAVTAPQAELPLAA
jgi:single-stranded DNA-binding protein